MADLEIRELEYFVAVAEELHFARAAARMRIAQPALSRAVARLEARLGARLLERDSRRVTLTEAGEALLHHARQVLAAAARASSSVQDVSHRAPLRIVLKPGADHEVVRRALAAFPEADEGVEIVFAGRDRVARLHDGRAHLGVLYIPFDDLDGLESVTLVEEPRVAVLPAGHRLAGRATVERSDLVGEPIVRWRGIPSDADGPEVDSVAELALLVSLGRAIAVLPRSVVGLVSADVVCVPVADLPPSRTVLAWRADRETTALRRFVALATGATTVAA